MTEDNAYSFSELIDIIREATLSGISDLHLRCGEAPYIRNVRRRIESFEPPVEGIPRRVVPDDVLWKLAKIMVAGTAHARRLAELETYETGLRRFSMVADLDSLELVEDEPVAQADGFVFSPCGFSWRVRCWDDETGEHIEARYRIEAARTEPAADGSGLCLALRRIWPRLPSYLHLNFNKAAVQLVTEIASGAMSSGLILVAGATGAGKSTTVAAILEEVNQKRQCNIVLFEDPPEYRFTPGKSIFRQIAVGRDVRDWEEAGRHALRLDPDLIVFGEIRSPEVARQALSLAQTGHLVICTLHGSTNTAGALTRFIGLLASSDDAQRKSLAHHTQAVVAQKLLPPRDEYTDGLTNPPVLVQEVMRPQRNEAIRLELLDGRTDPYNFYQHIGANNTKYNVFEITFNQALEEALQSGLIDFNTSRQAVEREEDETTARLADEAERQKLRTTGKQEIPEFLRRRTEPLPGNDETPNSK